MRTSHGAVMGLMLAVVNFLYGYRHVVTLSCIKNKIYAIMMSLLYNWLFRVWSSSFPHTFSATHPRNVSACWLVCLSLIALLFFWAPGRYMRYVFLSYVNSWFVFSCSVHSRCVLYLMLLFKFYRTWDRSKSV